MNQHETSRSVGLCLIDSLRAERPFFHVGPPAPEIEITRRFFV